MIFEIIVLLSALWMLFMSWNMTVRNIQSFLIYKATPFVLGTGLLVLSGVHYGYITVNF